MSPSLFKNDAQNSPSSDSGAPEPRLTPEPPEKHRRRGRPDQGVISVFGAGLVVEGEVRSHGDITIEGRVVGNVNVEGQLSVAGQGAIEGDIVAARVVVAGRVDGTITAKDGARLVSGAKVDADVKTERLELEEGAMLNGRIDMGSKKSRPAAVESSREDSEQKKGAA